MIVEIILGGFGILFSVIGFLANQTLNGIKDELKELRVDMKEIRSDLTTVQTDVSSHEARIENLEN